MPSVIFENHDYFSENCILQIRDNHSLSNNSITSNWHEHLEILICKSGLGALILDDRKYNFTEGNVFIVNPNVIHSLKSITEMHYVCLHIDKKFYLENFADLGTVKFIEFMESDKKTAEFLEQILLENSGNGELKNAKLKAIVLQLLIYLLENCRTDDLTSNHNSKSYTRIKNAMSYIENNLNRNLTLDIIAQAVGINKYQLSREFKATTNKNVFEYINHLRCKTAMALLKKGVTVTEAAESCGFQNLSYFSRTYKKYMGELPGKQKKS